MDRRARHAIDRAIAGFAAGQDGRHLLDGTAAAVYRIEPPGSECVALACLRCRTVTIKPGAPRLPKVVMLCNNCGEPWTLTPPPEVLAFGRSGLQVVGIDAPAVTPRPS